MNYRNEDRLTSKSILSEFWRDIAYQGVPPVPGLPVELASAVATIYGELPDDGTDNEWLTRFTEVIPDGADLSTTWHSFAEWMLTSPESSTLRSAYTGGVELLEPAAILHRYAVEGGHPVAGMWNLGN